MRNNPSACAVSESERNRKPRLPLIFLQTRSEDCMTGKSQGRFRKYAHHDGPLYYPEFFTDRFQPIIQQALLGLARYSVRIEGEMPLTPSLMMAYPHNEHINSVFFPPRETGFVVARDYWYENVLLRMLLATLFDSVPITRETTGASTLKQELLWQEEFMTKRQKNLVVYPQGSRVGDADSPAELAQDIKRGVALMARSLKVPVYPVGLVYPKQYRPKKNGESAWKRFVGAVSQGKLPEQTEITIRVGNPLSPPENRGQDVEFLNTLASSMWHLAHTQNT